MLYGKIGVTIVYNFALRKFDFRGWWSATPKIGGRSKKTQGKTALKTEAVVWQWVGTFKEAVPPPPSPAGYPPRLTALVDLYLNGKTWGLSPPWQLH